MTDTREQLRQLMDEHNLKAPEVGEMTGVKEQTVYGWLTKDRPTIPPYKLELLKFKLER